jgi:capsular polysaccharide biosynthesis protein
MASAVYTVQNSYQNYRRRSRFVLYPIFATFSRIIVCSNAALGTMPSSLKRLARRRIRVVQNAVDMERIDRTMAAAGGRRSYGGFTVASVGRLIDVKNPGTLMEAFERGAGDDSWLFYVGEGKLRSRLERRAESGGLARRVAFTGLVGRDDVYRYMTAADVCVSTSRGEGLPVAVLEAMACACPVVLSDIPPHREIAEGANFIPLVDPDDVEGFAEEIRRFHQMPPERRAAIGARCRRLVRERFGLPRMHAGIQEVYDEVHRPGVIRIGRSRMTENWEVPRVSGAARARWLLVAVLTLFGAGAGYALTLTEDPAYRATTGVMVGYTLRAPSIDDKEFEVTQSLAQTYAKFVRREPVLNPVIKKLNLATTWQALKNKVRAEVVADTPLVSISVDAATPDQAEAIAAAIGEQLVGLSPTSTSVSRLDFLNGRIQQLQADIEKAQGEITSLRQAQSGAAPADFARMERRIDELQRNIISWQGNYVNLVDLLNTQRASNQLSVYEPAVADSDPVVRDPVVFAAMGAMAGLFVGLAIAYAIQFMRGEGVPMVGLRDDFPAEQPIASNGSDWDARGLARHAERSARETIRLDAEEPREAARPTGPYGGLG